MRRSPPIGSAIREVRVSQGARPTGSLMDQVIGSRESLPVVAFHEDRPDSIPSRFPAGNPGRPASS